MNTTDRVTNILKYSIDSRNSDKELWLIYAQKSGVNLTPEQVAKIKDMPSFETLRRVRQKIQEQGLYQADPEIKKERSHKAMVMQQASPVYKPEHIEHTLTQARLDWGGL